MPSKHFEMLGIFLLFLTHTKIP